MRQNFWESGVESAPDSYFYAGNFFVMKNKILKSELDNALELCNEYTDTENILTAGNSFFEKFYFGTRILILAVCPGDEILIAGNTILNLSQAKAEIFIAYSVNSKINETALNILGIKKDKVIFLKNLERDLKNILLSLRANIIFCPDFDSNADYNILSTAFENIMGEILKSNQNYYPEVYKKFACATALNTPADFYAPNLLQVPRPNFELIDRANYSWKSRVRFPVPEFCQKTSLKDNILADAIFSYKNYRNDLNALRILNSDEIFFERRTDNQIYSAKISSDKIGNFRITGDTEKNKILIDWSEAVQVQRIVVYGNYLDSETHDIKIKLELDNFRIEIDSTGIYKNNIYQVEKILPAKGLPLIIDTEKIFVKHAEIFVENGLGIAEIEFFSNIEPVRKIQPFIKMTTDDNFFYKYYVPEYLEKISVGIYKFHVDGSVKISAEVDDENILTEILTGDEELNLNFGDAEEIILTAEVVGDSNIYDRAIIRKISSVEQIQMKIFQWLDKISS